MEKIIYQKSVEQWCVLEVSCKGPDTGNPYQEHWLKGSFCGEHEEVGANGFYDGDGWYRVRFMPSFSGEYCFRLAADFMEECGGRFMVTPACGENHGPVRVANRYHFAYEDGTPYYSVGTTCYVWELQDDRRIQDTLDSLQEAGFNKIRFCIFPKHYDYNLGEPRSYPYEGTPMDSRVLTKDNFNQYTGKKEGNHWDFFRFHPQHFRHIEKCILELQKLGIEADLIMMHPYDRWGFSDMGEEADDFYWKYAVARLAAFRNVWWSLANEYDLMKAKTEYDWERYARILCTADPYHHLRSIHNCFPFYDYNRPWITHCSIQRQDVYRTAENVNEWRIRFQKPVVLDEIAYEGNIQHGWGNISAREMVRRFWEAACRGGYAGHGETYMDPEDILWWSHGGKLHGESWKRLSFLKEILTETPGIGLKPCERSSFDEVCAVPESPVHAGTYYLYYYSFMRPSFRDFYFDDETEYEAAVIDTWNMEKKPAGRHHGKFRIALPGREYMAVQIKRVEEAGHE